jgi:hypothetical protein
VVPVKGIIARHFGVVNQTVALLDVALVIFQPFLNGALLRHEKILPYLAPYCNNQKHPIF